MRLVACSVPHHTIEWRISESPAVRTASAAGLNRTPVSSVTYPLPAGGADAAPYFRIFNPALQAAKFDPEGNYIRRWVPESGTSDYPRPIVNHTEARARALAALAAVQQR